jgi:hypothetical protein
MGSGIRFDSDDAVERARQRVLADAVEKTKVLRCPQHLQAVKLQFDGRALTISGCCLKFEKHALAVIGQN